MNDNLSSHQAGDYEQEVLKVIPHYAHFHAETCSLVKAMGFESGKWLDTGCGTGSLVEKALKEFPEFEFYLADPSKQMLDICRQKFNASNVLIVGELGTNSLEVGEAMDVITAVQSHHYLQRKEREEATRRCYKMLADQGVYISFENIRYNDEGSNKLALKRWAAFQEKMGRDPEEVQEHLSRFDTAYFPISIAEHLALLEQCGFKQVELFWLSHMQAGFWGRK